VKEGSHIFLKRCFLLQINNNLLHRNCSTCKTLHVLSYLGTEHVSNCECCREKALLKTRCVRERSCEVGGTASGSSPMAGFAY
jgi:hypothetical protein